MSELSRRDWLRIGALGSVAAMGGCARVANQFAEQHPFVPLPDGDTDEPNRLLSRLTFGARPGDISRVKALGAAAFIDTLLSPDREEDFRLELLLDRLDAFQVDSYELADMPEREILRQLQQAAILRAVYGRHQLQERMVDFWTNHFNIYSRKGLTAARKPADETKVIRENALGSFPEMLRASAHSPAMLMYLDNQLNIAGRPNENYAREIMELHTLGVNGGYSQRDVQEVARCFSGWTIERRFLHHRWSFRFDPDRHDNGVKRVLGHEIRDGGERDGDHVLEILAGHPSTARHISAKLCAYFLGSAGDRWIEPTARTYLASGGDIRSMLRPILSSRELFESPPILKRPFDYVVSALRALNAETDAGADLQEHLRKMGEPLYQWPMPDGYPTKTAAWTGTMLPRWNFAYALASNQIRDTDVDWGSTAPGAGPVEMFELTHARRPGTNDRVLMNRVQAEFQTSPDPQVGSGFLCLASPSFQWR